MNQTAAQMNQTAAQSANKTSINSAGNPKLTTSDIQDIRKTLDEVRKDIADGKATEALKAINDMDDKLPPCKFVEDKESAYGGKCVL